MRHCLTLSVVAALLFGFGCERRDAREEVPTRDGVRGPTSPVSLQSDPTVIANQSKLTSPQPEAPAPETQPATTQPGTTQPVVEPGKPFMKPGADAEPPPVEGGAGGAGVMGEPDGAGGAAPDGGETKPGGGNDGGAWQPIQ